jgi:hypothetical protein
MDSLYRDTNVLIFDHLTRHPRFGTVTIHALQVKEETVPDESEDAAEGATRIQRTTLGGIEVKAPVADFNNLVESDDIFGIDAAAVAYLQEHFGVETEADVPEPAPEPAPVADAE